MIHTVRKYAFNVCFGRISRATFMFRLFLFPLRMGIGLHFFVQPWGKLTRNDWLLFCLWWRNISDKRTFLINSLIMLPIHSLRKISLQCHHCVQSFPFAALKPSTGLFVKKSNVQYFWLFGQHWDAIVMATQTLTSRNHCHCWIETVPASLSWNALPCSIRRRQGN